MVLEAFMLAFWIFMFFFTVGEFDVDKLEAVCLTASF